MTVNELAHQFYSSFTEKNAEGMISCYSDDIHFYDPVFGNLYGAEAKAMWGMLTKNMDANGTIDYELVEIHELKAIVKWKASYPFGPKRRIVVNNITAELYVEDGKIVKHIDTFNLWKWSRQAFGVPGILLGWTPFFKRKLRSTVRKRLTRYMDEEPRF
ncbi:nuclear transport factor 2 family protein [Flavobacteriaceae bacterium TK19130]|nr:nuclear transport factor 2 family protein [Thermobacterium salinum]